MIDWFKHIIKFLYLSVKWYGKLQLGFSSDISLNSSFEGMNKIYPRSYFNGFLGLGSYISSDSHIEGKVGRFTSIAPHCNVIQGVHPYSYPFVSTSPIFFSVLKQNGYSFTGIQRMEELRYAEGKYPVVIGNDCWIGYGVSIVGGVKIGDGAVVLAGAVVTKGIPPYSIVGGIPAKVIGYRYSATDIKFLLDFRWWNKGVEWLQSYSELFLDIEKIKKVNFDKNKERG